MDEDVVEELNKKCQTPETFRANWYIEDENLNEDKDFYPSLYCDYRFLSGDNNYMLSGNFKQEQN